VSPPQQKSSAYIEYTRAAAAGPTTVAELQQIAAKADMVLTA
jgi:hypothetical protein